MQVHMPQAGTGCNAAAAFPGGVQNTLVIQRIGGHFQLAVIVLPFVAWTVAVDLDPIPIRIGEIEGFTNQVVCATLDLRSSVNQPAQ